MYMLVMVEGLIPYSQVSWKEEKPVRSRLRFTFFQKNIKKKGVGGCH